jgi:hypothetical protein
VSHGPNHPPNHPPNTSVTKQDLLDMESRITDVLRFNHNTTENHLVAMEGRIMTLQEQMAEELGRINVATTELAGDIEDALAKLSANPTPAEIAELKAALGNVAQSLEGTASKYPAPPTEKR